MKKSVMAGAAIVAAMTLGITQTAQASSLSPMWHDGGTFCLDDPNNSTVNGTAMQLWQCNSRPQQNIQVIAQQGGTGFYELQLENGKCLDDPNASRYNGTVLQIWTCNGRDSQSFTNGVDAYYGVSWVSIYNMAIDDYNNYDISGNTIQLWTYLGNKSQSWCSFYWC